MSYRLLSLPDRRKAAISEVASSLKGVQRSTLLQKAVLRHRAVVTFTALRTCYYFRMLCLLFRRKITLHMQAVLAGKPPRLKGAGEKTGSGSCHAVLSAVLHVAEGRNRNRNNVVLSLKL
ncbi:hypothetical protein Baya_14895 [Bagarius yarrelli]|uniref:Uncharacterized protein n=1 Tax=Bagarius yarrelli TaxID=175774 RepID=A0A556VA73_BAGYA|nr:hypothetical protein Baya_14895 [Bagarius yarrelli]